MLARPLFAALAVLASTLAIAATRSLPPRSVADQEAGAEPAMRLRLELAGRSVEVEVDRPFELAGEQAVLRLLPTRRFELRDFHFEYPTLMSYSAEVDDPDFHAWSFDGADAVLMVHRLPGEGDHVGAREEYASEIGEVFEVAEHEPATIDLGGRRVEGVALRVHVGELPVVQRVFSFGIDDRSYILIVQDSLDDDERPTAEARELEALLSSTFAFRRE